MNRVRPISPEMRALVTALLETHSIGVTFLLLRNTASGEPVSRKQVEYARDKMLEDRRRAARQAREAKQTEAALALAACCRTASPPQPPLTFEQQLARVAAGARLVPTFRVPRTEPAITLGGVASGSL